MAVEYKTTMAKSELLELAAANGIHADDGMTKAAIIDAIDAYNAQGTADGNENRENNAAEGGNEDAEENDSTEKENTAESLVEGAKNTVDENNDLFAYAGPTLPHGRLKENAVFRGTLHDVKDYLADVLEEYPQAERLIVPVNKLAEFSVKVKTPGNLAHKYYSDIVSAMHGDREV